LVHFRPAIFFRRALTSGVSDGDRAASNRNSTAVETLLTFCPPGPEARIKLSLSSQSCKVMSSLMRIIKCFYPSIGRKAKRKGRNIRAALSKFSRAWRSSRSGPITLLCDRLHLKDCLQTAHPRIDLIALSNTFLDTGSPPFTCCC
jgi:hypothetical protein